MFIIFKVLALIVSILKNTILNAGNSGTLARLILGLLVRSKRTVKLIGDKAYQKEIFLG